MRDGLTRVKIRGNIKELIISLIVGSDRPEESLPLEEALWRQVWSYAVLNSTWKALLQEWRASDWSAIAYILTLVAVLTANPDWSRHSKHSNKCMTIVCMPSERIITAVNGIDYIIYQPLKPLFLSSIHLMLYSFNK